MAGRHMDGALHAQVFAHMQAAAAGNPACAPNVITYSALMTACCAGGRPDKAYEVFQVRLGRSWLTALSEDPPS